MDTRIPDGTPEMDPLQRAGAVALIEDGFDSVRSVEGSDGVKVDLLDSIVAVHPGGAHLKVIVDARTLESAEDTVEVLVDELLERTELLAEWKIERCEVELHQQLAKESLDAAGGPDAPPDDPAARKARHTEGLTAEDADGSHDAEAGTEAVRRRMAGLADELRSFSPVVFGVDGKVPVSPESAALAAGALVHAADSLVAELFEDVQVLAQEDTNVAECEGPLWHLERLPDRYALRYDARFARRFLVTVIALTTRFTDGSFRRLGCVAEDLALRFLLGAATTALELHGLLDDEVSAALTAFADHVYEGTHHAWLYDDPTDGADGGTTAAALGVTPMAFGSWFTPFDEGGYTHPSAADAPETAPR